MSSQVSPIGPQCHTGSGSVGLLIVHGYTATPMSMAPIADAARSADLPFEQPLLPGHGTVIDDLLPVRWADWRAHVRAAADRLAERVDRVVAVGQSLGGALVLDLAASRPLAGVVAINPLIRPRPQADHDLLNELIESGAEIVPPLTVNPDRADGGDIADPDAVDWGYTGTPLQPLKSALVDGIEPMEPRLGEIAAPLLLFTSRVDHVVDPADSVFLAERYGGPVDHRWLERSYHVAAIDFDRDLIADSVTELALQLR